MGDVLVRGGTLAEGRIAKLEIELHGLPARSLERDTVLRWMKDGHSFVPLVAGGRAPALQLVEVGEEHFIRTDNQPESSDTLPEFTS